MRKWDMERFVVPGLAGVLAFGDSFQCNGSCLEDTVFGCRYDQWYSGGTSAFAAGSFSRGQNGVCVVCWNLYIQECGV